MKLCPTLRVAMVSRRPRTCDWNQSGRIFFQLASLYLNRNTQGNGPVSLGQPFRIRTNPRPSRLRSGCDRCREHLWIVRSIREAPAHLASPGRLGTFRHQLVRGPRSPHKAPLLACIDSRDEQGLRGLLQQVEDQYEQRQQLSRQMFSKAQAERLDVEEQKGSREAFRRLNTVAPALPHTVRLADGAVLHSTSAVLRQDAQAWGASWGKEKQPFCIPAGG